MSDSLKLAMQLADDIDEFPLGKCGPCDDPEMQYAYTAAFRDIAVRFLAAVKRIGDPDLVCQVGDWDLSQVLISEAHALRSELRVVADSLRERAQDPNYAFAVAGNAAFLAPDLLAGLKATSSARPIADLHSHVLMRSKEHLPTKNQIEPYKAGFEILIHEVLAKLGNEVA